MGISTQSIYATAERHAIYRASVRYALVEHNPQVTLF